MKEVWPNSGHKLLELIDKAKTLKLNLKKGSWNMYVEPTFPLQIDMKLLLNN